jgi:hypothetical protein
MSRIVTELHFHHPDSMKIDAEVYSDCVMAQANNLFS